MGEEVRRGRERGGVGRGVKREVVEKQSKHAVHAGKASMSKNGNGGRLQGLARHVAMRRRR